MFEEEGEVVLLGVEAGRVKDSECDGTVSKLGGRPVRQ